MSQAIEEAAWFQDKIADLKSALGEVVVGQENVVEGVLVCLAANGHVLLEGMPGLGKTLLVRTLADTLKLSFSRIQFTPDMMPADVSGTNVLAQSDDGARHFEFRQGPIFANLVLADEINRATPKTQSALLEAMQERQVTVAGTSHTLPDPFLVMATQNPIEQEGTYPLPEAQLDRFFFKLLVPYPKQKDLTDIILRTTGILESKSGIAASGDDIRKMRSIVRQVEIVSDVLQYGLSLVVGTHPEGAGATEVARQYCRYGSSPRGAQALVTAGKVYALMDGRFNVSKDDLRKAAQPALRHRILLNFEAEAESVTTDMVIDKVIQERESSVKDPVSV